MTDETTAGHPVCPATPELDRLVSVSAESQKIGEFLEWLSQERKLVLCELERDEYWPCFMPINDLLALYFKIDLSQVAHERAAILEYARKINEEGS
jgi:hypothetical protein